MEKRENNIIISEENDYVGHLSIMLFLTSTTFIGINIWHNPAIHEYQQIKNDYSFTAQTYINYLEIGYILFLIGTIYSYKRLNYNYDMDLERSINWHQLIIQTFTLFTQIFAITICNIAPDVEIYEKTNGLIGKEIQIPNFYVVILNASYFIIPILFLYMLLVSYKIFLESEQTKGVF